MRQIHRFFVLAAAGLLGACTISPEQNALQAGQCAAAMSLSPASVTGTLDPQGFSLLNWNIEKARNPGWASTLERVAGDADLYLLQEASPRFRRQSPGLADAYTEYAMGFRLGESGTGVMTIGDVPANAACRLTAREPVFGTRKATLVTRYAISGIDDGLLVVNMHGVNFSLGLAALESQLAVVSDLLASHDGPAILSGDFNTWRRARQELLERYTTVLGMQPVEFQTDHRKTFFGWPLDHVYARGLETVSAKTFETDSSDHNPMHVRFRVSALML